MKKAIKLLKIDKNIVILMIFIIGNINVITTLQPLYNKLQKEGDNNEKKK